MRVTEGGRGDTPAFSMPFDGSIGYSAIDILDGLLGRVEDRSSEGRGGEEAGLACQWQDSGACERHGYV